MIFRDNCNMDLDTNSLVSGGRVARPEGSSKKICGPHWRNLKNLSSEEFQSWETDFLGMALNAQMREIRIFLGVGWVAQGILTMS